MKNLKALLVLIVFTFTNFMPPQGWAQGLETKQSLAALTAVGLMPKPGSTVSLSANFDLAHFKGMVIDPNDPFKFDFIIHQGDQLLSPSQKQLEYTKLIKYFLAALAIPDTDQWVNLSPYEKNRIIAFDFGKTEMGRDLLAQDYLLKQLSSSLTNPETSLGQKFWDRTYERVYQEFGTRNVPLNSFNKVWIVPDRAVIYEEGNMVYVLSSHLKVMTEADYLSMKKHGQNLDLSDKGKAENISNQVMRQVILPAIEQEVNEGKNFAPLRQVFSGMLLATWYKHALRESILGQLYANKKKTKGIDSDPRSNEQIYHDYLRAYKKGVYNMIKEETDPVTQEVIPRKYFSGGINNNFAQVVQRDENVEDYREDLAQQSSKLADVTIKMRNIIARAASVLKKARVKFITGAVLGLSLRAHGTSLDVRWDASTDTNVMGYKVYCGTVSQQYTNVIVAGNTNSIVIGGAQPGITYYIAATSYNNAGWESAYSSEISFTVPFITSTSFNIGASQLFKIGGNSFFEFNFTPPEGTTPAPLAYVLATTNSLGANAVWKVVGTISTDGTNSVKFISPWKNVPQEYFQVVPSTNNFSSNENGLLNHEVSTWALSATVTEHGSPVNIPIKEIAVDAKKKDAAQKATVLDQKFTRGGIDFAESTLEMQVKRNGKGIVLPVSQQDLDSIHINGLYPEILEIRPIGKVPFFSKAVENNL